MHQDSIRLEKALAVAGVASRRACAKLIEEGRVTVNGEVVREPGARIHPQNDRLAVEGRAVSLHGEGPSLTLMVNKPVGVVSTAYDPEGRPTVLVLVGELPTRVYPVGRLDIQSSGLLLLTNDGDLAFRLTHPRFEVPKTYRVVAKGFVGAEVARALSEGVLLEDGLTAPAEVRFVKFQKSSQSTVLDITIREGRNRQVRRMMEAVGHPVRELTRIGFGPLRLRGLAPGTWRKLRPDELAALRAMAEREDEVRAAAMAGSHQNLPKEPRLKKTAQRPPR